VLKNLGGVYSCSCAAWRNQGAPIERRTCKHLKKLRGAEVEMARCLPGAEEMEAAMEKHDLSPVGRTKDAPPLLLAHSWDGEQDLTGWWMSEKLDGVRAYWNGKDFISRLGNVYHAPEWFKEGLPNNRVLDGELWLGRKRFQECVSIVRRQDKSDQWRAVNFLAFDSRPTRAGGFADATFESRMDVVEKSVSGVKFAAVVSHEQCQGVPHLRQKLMLIEKVGGEGLMLRAPGSLYEVGRSHTLLKVKSFKDDEARVVGHEPGKGKHKGRLGALVVEMKNGTRFSVGTGFTDAERRDPPKVGELITFRYQELSTGGVPRFPVYVGPAPDKE